jgi:hypothetical protein
VACLFVALVFPVTAGGQPHAGRGRRPEVEVVAEASPRRVSQHDVVVLEVTVTTVVPVRGSRFGSASFDRFDDPSVEGFEVLSTSSQQSTRITFGGGRAERISSHTKRYQLRPKKVGRLKIGAARVRVSGRYYSSKPLHVTVVKGKTPPPLSPGQRPQLPKDEAEIFVQVQAEKQSVYVGEQLNVSWYVYHKSRLISFAPVTTPSADDFLVEEVYQIGPQTQSQRQVIDGRDFLVTPLYRKALFPLEAGKLSVGHLEAKLSTVRTRYQHSFPTVQRRSSPLEVEVKPLPEEGKPAGFHPGNVGQLSVEARVDSRKIDAGQAATLTIIVSGKGHPSRFELPALDDIKGFKIRPAKPRVDVQAGETVRGTKTYEFVLIGVKDGKHEVPGLEIAYFDPKAEQYRVARSEPISIEVEGSLSPSPAAGGTGTGQVNVLKRDIKPIHRSAGLSSGFGARFWSSWLFKLLVFAPVALLLLLLAWSRLRLRLSRETEARRWRRAKGLARRRFRVARHKIAEDDRSGFYAEVSRVLQEMLTERLGEKVQGMTTEELHRSLLDQGFAQEQAEAVVKELQNCDFARFAPAASNRDDMDETLKRARRLVGEIQRSKARKLKRPAAKAADGR